MVYYIQVEMLPGYAPVAGERLPGYMPGDIHEHNDKFVIIMSE